MLPLKAAIPNNLQTLLPVREAKTFGKDEFEVYPMYLLIKIEMVGGSALGRFSWPILQSSFVILFLNNESMLHLHQPNVGFKSNWSAQSSLPYFTLRLELHSLSVLAPAFPAKMYQPPDFQLFRVARILGSSSDSVCRGRLHAQYKSLHANA